MSIPVKNPRDLRSKSNYVEMHCEWMVIKMYFTNREDACEFAIAASKSKSITGITLYLNGRFAGGLDGAGG